MPNIIQLLPIQYIITVLFENPDAQTFDWNGRLVSRQELVNETLSRPLPATVDGHRAGIPINVEVITAASRKRNK